MVKRSKPGSVPNELYVRATEGIRLEDISIEDRVSYIHPSGGGQHIATVKGITKKGIIHTMDWVGDKLNIGIANVRSIWVKREAQWVKLPLHREGITG